MLGKAICICAAVAFLSGCNDSERAAQAAADALYDAQKAQEERHAAAARQLHEQYLKDMETAAQGKFTPYKNFGPLTDLLNGKRKQTQENNDSKK